MNLDPIVQLLQDQYDLSITQHSELIQLVTDNHNALLQSQSQHSLYIVSFMAGLVFAALLTYLLDRSVVK